MLYELILIFTLFQHKDDVRRLLVYIDPELGTPLEEMDYRSVFKLYPIFSSKVKILFFNLMNFDIFHLRIGPVHSRNYFKICKML